MKKKSILLVGAGGHAQACIDLLEAEGSFRIHGLVGENEEKRRTAHGYPIIGKDSDLDKFLKSIRFFMLGVGQIKSPAPRQKLFSKIKRMGGVFPVVASPFSHVSPRASLDEGTVVMHGAVVQSGAGIGKNCILNSQCLIEHGGRVGDHCHISTGVILNGEVQVGEGSFIGSGSIIQEGVSIPPYSIIPMGTILRYQSRK